MSGLADRIRAIVVPSKAAHVTADPEPGAATGEPSSAAAGDDAIDAVLGGAWRDRCLVVERRWESTAPHGRVLVGDIAAQLESAMDDAPLISGGAAARTPFVFFDLETTGLSGGAGTYAFLVGCGWFEDGAFVTRQYVMTRLGDERPMLGTVAGDLDRAGAIVSFNGKSFDAPVLETRYAFHRLAWAGDRVPHVDVLHPARQFWGGSAARWVRVGPGESSCSLGALERQLLGKRRTGDVPGIEIPSRYFQFVRTRDARPLRPVLEHNRLDLLSLAAITARLLQLTKGGPESTREPREALALGRVYQRAGYESRAREAFRRAIDLCAAPPNAYDVARIESVRALALACRRARQFDEAAGWWRTLLDTRGCPPAIAREAREALAIHNEHRVRDLRTARAFAIESLEDVEGGRAGWNEAVKHRLARLDRKLELSGTRQPSLSWPSPPSSAVQPSARRTSS